MKDLLSILSAHWPSLLLLALSAPFYAYCALHDEGKLKGWGPDEGFFGDNQYKRKYSKSLFPGKLLKAPDHWYYKFFKLKYAEAYPFSATILAWTTDGYHLFQLVWKALIIDSMAILTPWPWTMFHFGILSVHIRFRSVL